MGNVILFSPDPCADMLQVLHPGLKLEYFRHQSWEADWINEAEDLVGKEF
jgi:hypothetical protein